MARLHHITEDIPLPVRRAARWASTLTAIAAMVSLSLAAYIHLTGQIRETAIAAVQAHELKRLEEAHRDSGNVFAGRLEVAECRRMIEAMQAELMALKHQQRRRKR